VFDADEHPPDHENSVLPLLVVISAVAGVAVGPITITPQARLKGDVTLVVPALS
jgi:hypothetical protein